METLRGFPNLRLLPATLPPLAALGLARSGGAARGASEGREGRGVEGRVEGEVPKHRRRRWAKPVYAYAFAMSRMVAFLR
jgi:hypothetical protein